MQIYVHLHIGIAVFCRGDAPASAQNLPNAPHPVPYDMRQVSRTKISLGLCSFFCVHNRSPLAEGTPTEPWLSIPPHLQNFFGWSLW